MAKATSIYITPNHVSFMDKWGYAFIFWPIMVISVSICEIYLGGSWVVNLVILFFVVSAFATYASRVTGISVRLTRGEVVKWVGDGAPSDVKAWKDSK